MPDALVAALAALLPGTVQVAGFDPGEAAPAWPGEELCSAIPARQREFATGRAAARVALARLGHAPGPLPMGPDRAPVWPDGVVGSITHTAGAGLVAVAHNTDLVALGIDLEQTAGLTPDLWPTVLLPEERALLRAAGDLPHLATLIFSAKEAAFKAQYPLTAALLGFDALHIMPDLATGRFHARFRSAAPPFAGGSLLEGRFHITGRHVITAVALPA